MADNMTLWNSWRQAPEGAKKPITAGRLKGMTDINPIWRYEMLTERFGPCGIGWYTDEEQYELHPGAQDQVVVTCRLKLYYRDPESGEWSKGVSGQGGSMLVAAETKGLYTSDEAFKMAYTDAISVACKQLGIGADVYWSRGETKYSLGKPGSQAPCVEDGDPLALLQCADCGASLTKAVYLATKKQFGRPLCPACRKGAESHAGFTK